MWFELRSKLIVSLVIPDILYKIMILNLHRQYRLKKLARSILALFILSVINMSFQLPAHAAMQLNMSVSVAIMDHSGMSHEGMNHQDMMQQMDTLNCECPPVLCDAVDAQHDQLFQSLVSFADLELLEFYPVYLTVQQDSLDLKAGHLFQYHDWHFRQTSPPPISLTTELQI